MKHRDTETLIQAAFDGGLDEAAAATLAARLHDSRDALEAYCDHALLEAELCRQASGARKIPGAIPAGARLRARNRRRRIATISLAAAAAVILLAATILRMVWLPMPAHTEVALAPGSTFTRLGGGETAAEGIAIGSSWMLGQGVAELRMANDVRAVIDGPAVIDFLSEDRIGLSGGHAWFHVPPAAAGFRVLAPDFEVTDLGTAFGIDMREDLPPQVHCLDGRILIQARRGNRASATLDAGTAATLEPNGRWTAIPADAEKFRTTLPSALPALHLALEEFANGGIPIRGDLPGTHHATARVIHPERARIIDDGGGPALQFDGAFIETDWPGISGTAPRTFTVWCRLPAGTAPATAPPLALWGNPATGWSRKFKIGIIGSDEGTILRVSFGETMVNGITHLADGEWHHLAVSYLGNDPDGRPIVRMFVNGREESTTIIDLASSTIVTETETSRSTALTLGRYELPARGRDPFLRATLRGYHIHAGELTPEEIRAMARAEKK